MNLAGRPQSGQAMLQPWYPLFSGPQGRSGGRRRPGRGPGRGGRIPTRRRVGRRGNRSGTPPSGARPARRGGGADPGGRGLEFRGRRRWPKGEKEVEATWLRSCSWVKARPLGPEQFPALTRTYRKPRHFAPKILARSHAPVPFHATGGDRQGFWVEWVGGVEARGTRWKSSETCNSGANRNASRLRWRRPPVPVGRLDKKRRGRGTAEGDGDRPGGVPRFTCPETAIIIWPPPSSFCTESRTSATSPTSCPRR